MLSKLEGVGLVCLMIKNKKQTLTKRRCSSEIKWAPKKGAHLMADREQRLEKDGREERKR